MLAEYPGVVAEIVPEEALAPVVVVLGGSPRRAGGPAHGVGVGGEDAGDVVGAAGSVLAQPQEVEDTDGAIRSGRAGLLVVD